MEVWGMLKKNLANLITCVRLVGTTALIFLPVPPSISFFVVYCVCGISDILDGWVARSTGTQSVIGSRLDSIADLYFYAVMLLKIIGRLFQLVPVYLWCLIFTIVAIRIFDYLYTAFKFHHMASMHTILNKISGGMMFAVPFLLETGTVFLVYVCLMIAVTGAAAVQELVLHIRMKPESARVSGTVSDI